mmetsp:Transcript_107123/g.301485  ORF Transcript_107123/g.301485 Transcript_107123/m.301485 type:complete len:355 (+) Transcript_107123:73-1137(+)
MDAAADLAHVREALVRRYGIEASDIELLDAGSTPNHAVTAVTGAKFLVKALRSRLGQWVAENAQQITAISAHAVVHSLPTPAPVRATDGGLVAVEHGPREDEETHFVVFEWAEGYQRADHFLVAEPGAEGGLLAILGALLAKLHSLPPPADIAIPAPEAPGGHCLCDMGSFLEFAGDTASLFQGQDSEDARWFRKWLPALAELWRRMPGPAVMCHGDAYLDNVLAKAGTPLELMLVDWEDACTTNPVVDLAACAVGTCFTLSLGEESENVSVELVRERLAALVGGYVRQRPLGDADRALLRPSMQACAWACGAFRYSRFLEGVADVKTRKYGQLIEVVNILEDMGDDFDAIAFA